MFHQVLSCQFIIGMTRNFIVGYAGVFYEKLLKKGNQPSVIIRYIHEIENIIHSLYNSRNLQLGLFSLCFSFIGMVYYTKDTIMEKGIFYGYTIWVVILIILQSGKKLYKKLNILFNNVIIIIQNSFHFLIIFILVY